MTQSAYYCPLVHEGVLAVSGADASTFLQGQLTCNLKYLDAEHSGLGARCTAKGRMQSSFRILPQGADYLLAMARDVLELQLADLKKYAVFSKSTLSDASSQWLRWGLSGADDLLAGLGLALPADANCTVRHDGLIALRLPDGRAELWAPAERAQAVEARLSASLPLAPLDTWLLDQVRAGIGQVFGPTRELFIPQMINLQALDGVSFKKGCYTGQEIVARMQYLGKLKRRMYRLAGSPDAVPAPGTALFSPVHATSVGEVVLAAPAGTGIELLAVAQEDAIADGRLFLGAPDGAPLSLLALPYSLDNQREIQR